MPITELIEYEFASPEVREVYDDIMATRKTDWINNFWKALANHPPTLRRTWESIKQIMGPGALDPLTKEMIYLAVSAANGCDYCIASHTAAARKAGMTPAMRGELLAVVGMACETNSLADAEEREQQQVAGAGGAGLRGGRGEQARERGGERGGGEHAHVAIAPQDHRRQREGQRHREGEEIAADRARDRLGVEVARDHDGAAQERHAHRGPRAPGHALTHPEPAEEPGHERAQALDDQHVRDRGAVQRHDETGGSDGEAGRHRQAAPAHAQEDARCPAALPQRGHRHQEGRAEGPAPEHGGPRIGVHEARDQAAGAPAHRGRPDQEPAAPRRLALHRAIATQATPASTTTAPASRRPSPPSLSHTLPMIAESTMDISRAATT